MNILEKKNLSEQFNSLHSQDHHCLKISFFDHFSLGTRMRYCRSSTRVHNNTPTEPLIFPASDVTSVQYFQGAVNQIVSPFSRSREKFENYENILQKYQIFPRTDRMAIQIANSEHSSLMGQPYSELRNSVR